MPHNNPNPSSFRDPAGFIFTRDGEIFRQVNADYQPHYERLMRSGLYDQLVAKGWLIAHQEEPAPPDVFRVIKPERIVQISYPYEWSFSQFKAAALLTLEVQELALTYGMTLKDASAFNIQFRGCVPVFIDTLSFECLDESKPWVAYRQYCEHFLAPIALMHRIDPRLRKLLLGFIDGIPLEVASRALPLRSWLTYSTLVHIHIHSQSQRRHANTTSATPRSQPVMSKQLLAALIQSLRKAIEGCQTPLQKSEWGDYYAETNYSDAAMKSKEEIVTQWLNTHWQPGQTIHDLGANTGRFSRLSAASTDASVVSYDVDELAVERNFLKLREESDYQQRILPLVLDLTNPSPSLGWAHTERDGFMERCCGGFTLALALVHHLAISNNTPFSKIAEFFAEVSETLLIEFVPKADSQVQRLLATREDVFPHYNQEAFEQSFSKFFRLQQSAPVEGSKRTLYLWTRRDDLNRGSLS